MNIQQLTVRATIIYPRHAYATDAQVRRIRRQWIVAVLTLRSIQANRKIN
jgi:hypothetical protein